MHSLIANFLKLAGRTAGLEITRFSRTPQATLLSIKHLQIRTIIDVGANEGQFARLISSFFPHARIIAFEPQRDAFELLSQWASSQSGRVKCFNNAVGETKGTLQMYKHVDYYFSSSILKSTEAHTALAPNSQNQTSIPIEMVTLDGFLSDNALDLPAEILVKMDVQGYEDRVISGGQETMGRAKACIIEVCLDTLYENQARFEGIVTKCSEAGLRYAGNLHQAYATDGHVQVIDAVFVRGTK